jgi:hypothetical protein
MDQGAEMRPVANRATMIIRWLFVIGALGFVAALTLELLGRG